MSAYTIKLTNGQDLVTIQDGMADTTHSSITLFGKNFAGYGLLLNENQVKVLENFSSPTAPHFPLEGQLWWDSQANQMKVFRDHWKVVSGPSVSPIAPSSDTIGDLWYNTTEQQLKVFNGTSWTLVGPSYTTTQGVSGPTTVTVRDSNDIPHTVVEFLIGGAIVGILSKDTAFPIITIPGFSVIKPGFNLPVGTFAGNADNALGLAGVTANNFLRSDIESTTNNQFNVKTNSGLQVGLNDDLHVYVDGQAIKFNSTVAHRDIQFNVTIGSIPSLALGIDSATGQLFAPVAPTTNTSLTNKLYVDSAIATSGANFLRADGATALAGNITVASNDLYSLGTVNNSLLNVYATNFSGTTVSAGSGTFTTVTLNGPMTSNNSAVTKLYVDTLNTATTSAIGAQVTQQYTQIVGNPPAALNSLEKIASSINNNPAYHSDMLSRFALLAPVESPFFTGDPRSPTVQNNSDSSDKIATTAFVRTAVGSLSSNLTTSLGQYALIDSPAFTGRPQAPTPLVSEAALHPSQIATLSYVSSKITDAIGSTISGSFAPISNPTLTGTTSLDSLQVSGNASIQGTTTTKDLTVNGNFVVNGTTTTMNTATLDVADINITVAKNAATASAANGAGLTVGGPAAATMTYLFADDSWNFNKVVKASGFTGTASNAAKVDITSSTLLNVPVFPVWSTGIGSTALVTSSSLSFVPQTGAFTATSFTGSGSGLTNIQNSATSATASSVGETIVMRDASKNFSANTITATTFSGSGASLTNIPNSALNATPLPNPNTIVLRDANSNFAANLISATSTTAQYADLAENYVADAYYAPGTVLDFGGDKEVTLSDGQNLTRVAGVVTTNPAYLMNSDCKGEHIAAIALQGRVPVMVIGMVQKGDLLVSYGNGYAKRAIEPKTGTVIGKALEAHTGEASLIEVSVGRC
jgi:hypothetical protein